MAKKGSRVQVILECTEHKASGKPGTSRYGQRLSALPTNNEPKNLITQ